jgi:hypothetical protein
MDAMPSTATDTGRTLTVTDFLGRFGVLLVVLAALGIAGIVQLWCGRRNR